MGDHHGDDPQDTLLARGRTGSFGCDDLALGGVDTVASMEHLPGHERRRYYREEKQD